MPGLIGCDLEYAFRSRTGKFMPAGVLPITGRKGNPEKMITGGVEIDCCAVELTMKPAANEDEFVNTILPHLEAIRQRFSSFGDIITVPSVTFEEKDIRKHRYASEMGCDPDFNAWTEEENPRPQAEGGFRTFGGHIHIEGGTIDTIKACDLTLGMWSVCNDSDKKRRKLYGKAGAYRPKDYGVEYRVLSNFWCGNEELIRKVWKLTETAKELANSVDDLVKICGGKKRIQDIINTSSEVEAFEILKTIGVH